MFQTLQICVCITFLYTSFAELPDPEVLLKVVQDCAAKSDDIPESEYLNYQVILSPLASNIQCIGKCIAENVQVIDGQGNINYDKANGYLNGIPENVRVKAVECGKELGKIEQCEDVETFRKCIIPVLMNPKYIDKSYVQPEKNNK